MHLDVAVPSSVSQPHRRVAGSGRGAPKPPRMGSRRNIGMHGEVGPIGRRVELERLARSKGGLMAGSPTEAGNVAAASLARWRRWLSVDADRRGPAPG